MPPDARRLRSPQVFGRDSEAAVVQRLLVAAREGISGTLVVVGEPGVGKTELMRHAVDAATGMRILKARGVESESELAFSGLHDIFRPVLSRLDQIPAPQAAALAGALGLGPPVAPSRLTIYAGVLSLLAAAAEELPAVAVIDDAHWLDTSSRDALLFAARRLEAEGVLMLFAVRDDESQPFDKAEIPKLRLQGLDRAATRQLLVQTVSRDLRQSLVDGLYDATGGNPLALVEIGTATRLGDVDEASLSRGLLPAMTVEHAFLRRVDRVSQDARRALLVAAANRSRRRATAEVACAELGLGADALDDAVSAQLLVADSVHVELRHPLLRTALYRAARTGERRAVHAALANALAAEGAADERAWHLAAAAAGPTEEAASALDAAAAAARDRAGFVEAALAFERAAELTEEPEQRARRLLEAARSYELSGDWTHIEPLANKAVRATKDPLVRATAQHLRGRVLMWRGSPREAHRSLVGEAGRVEPLDSGRAALMLASAAAAAIMSGDVELGIATAGRGHVTGSRTGPQIEKLAGAALGTALMLHAEVAEARPLVLRLAELLAHVPHHGGALSRDELLSVLPHYPFTLVWLEEYGKAQGFLDALLDDARSSGTPGVLVVGLLFRSVLSFTLGNWDDARSEASEALELGRQTAQENSCARALVYLARLDAAQGREEACRASCREALEIVERLRSGSLRSYACAALGLLELGLGRPGHAVGQLAEAERLCVRGAMRHPAVTCHGPDLVEALARAGERDQAQAALAAFTARAEATGSRWALATADRCRGLLAPDDEFTADFEGALARQHREPSAFEYARTQLCYGERLRRARRRGEARECLNSAVATFDRLGARPWAEQARTELRATGETVRPRDARGLAELTPQELRVALTIARGSTNREAASLLWLSQKTIEAHLHRIYVKLGIRSRTELALYLAREGVIGRAA
jgi:DNA-binding CsgD family transcriptional regulator